MAKRIGIFGGTFNPIHIGHLRSALEVMESYHLDELRLMPNALPPHRAKPAANALQRLTMVQLAVQDVQGLSVDDLELQRDTPSWTIDTLLVLRQQLSTDDQLLLILGWDAFCGLPTWHRWQEILQHCHLLVLQRPDFDVEAPQTLRDLIAARAVASPQALQGPAGQISFVWQTPLAVSATQIRQRLAQNLSVRFLVPDTVLNYIQTQGLYQS
ncbi:nicotinate-nucleotide adenylyltransferase [Pseudomonas sp. F1_0610]|uniref:nicotinate-nucleotide adenylyltransferase n=1 Tax=Pseudomonas sp. F1_0610 TaxID=3114284 RepID=UPI0039C4048B